MLRYRRLPRGQEAAVMDGKNLLIVVDYQNDFVSGTLGFDGAQLLDLRIAAKIKAYHDAGDVVVFTYDTHRKNYLNTQEGRKLPVAHCICGTEGWELYGETAKQQREEDLCFQKPTFPSLELADYISEEEFERIELVGLVSHMCVLSNAVMAKAAAPEAEIVIDASCTASFDPVLHEKALDLLEALQMTVENR